MQHKFAIPAFTVVLLLAGPAFAAGPEPCQSDNRWCARSGTGLEYRARQNYSPAPTDPDPRIRAEMVRDKVEDKGQ